MSQTKRERAAVVGTCIADTPGVSPLHDGESQYDDQSARAVEPMAAALSGQEASWQIGGVRKWPGSFSAFPAARDIAVRVRAPIVLDT